MLPIGRRGAPHFSAVQEETESIKESEREKPSDIFENENFLELENLKPMMTSETNKYGGTSRLGKQDEAM